MNPVYQFMFCICFYSACPPGLYGANCEDRCECRNSAECDPVSGDCMCAPGWYGVGCDQSKYTNQVHSQYADNQQ